jgi:hypothetical protein
LNFVDTAGPVGNYTLSQITGINRINGFDQTVRSASQPFVAMGAAGFVESVIPKGFASTGQIPIPPFVFLDGLFSTLDTAEQNTILVHEALHVGMQMNDARLAFALGATNSVLAGDNAMPDVSQAISNWLGNDCEPQQK